MHRLIGLVKQILIAVDYKSRMKGAGEEQIILFGPGKFFFVNLKKNSACGLINDEFLAQCFD